jgi:hypothetical protein
MWLVVGVRQGAGRRKGKGEKEEKEEKEVEEGTVVSGGAATRAGDLIKASSLSPSYFRVSRTVNILRRPFLLHDCDAFRKNYSKESYGICEFPVIELSRMTKLVPIREIPEWGWVWVGGGEEEAAAGGAGGGRGERLRDQYKQIPTQTENNSPKNRFSSISSSVHIIDLTSSFFLSQSLSLFFYSVVVTPKSLSHCFSFIFLSSKHYRKRKTHNH